MLRMQSTTAPFFSHDSNSGPTRDIQTCIEMNHIGCPTNSVLPASPCMFPNSLHSEHKWSLPLSHCKAFPLLCLPFSVYPSQVVDADPHAITSSEFIHSASSQSSALPKTKTNIPDLCVFPFASGYVRS